MDQREKFEAWHGEKFRWVSKRDDIHKHNYLDQRTQGLWEAWQAAIAAQEPKQAMADEQIMEIYDAQIAKGGSADHIILQTARAIERAVSPNKELVEALAFALPLAEQLGRNFGANPDNDPDIIKAHAALRAAGVEVAS